MKYVGIAIGLIFALYLEAIFFHFPLFFVFSSLLLLSIGGRVLAIYIFLLSAVLDSLLVNIFGITALFIFLYTFVLGMYFTYGDLRGRIVLFVSLLLSSIFYSMVVGYPVQVPFYFLVVVGYGLFEYWYSRRNSHHKLIPWV